jgi:hypothetical protein
LTFEASQPGASTPSPHDRPGKRSNKRLPQVLVVAAFVVYAVILAEAFVRVFDPQPVMPRYVTGTAWGVRGNIPNARYWHHTPEVDVQYRVNSQGMRADREYPFRKPPGTCRLAIFGDSFFFGYEVDLRDSFAGQLERRLRKGGIPAEVLNFAVSGFGTAEMLQTYEKFGRRFDPDVVIFSWDVTDTDDNVRSGLYRLKDGQLERANAEYLPAVKLQDLLMRYRLYSLIADHSQFYSFVREQINLFLKGLLLQARRASLGSAQAEQVNGEGQSAAGVSDSTQRRHALELSSAIVLHAHDVVTSDAHDFYLFEIPYRVSRVQFAPTVDVLATAVRSRIKVVSALAALSRAARPDLKLFYERGQGHLTPTGIEILVDEMARALASSSQLASCASGTNHTVNASDMP